MNFVTYAKCIGCGAVFTATPNLTVCKACGGILDIHYDYTALKQNLTREKIAERRPSMWRYRELMPMDSDFPLSTLQVGWSPLYDSLGLAQTLDLHHVYIKDDGLNPTSSLKDRASALAVIKAKEAGATTVACASTGNAASSLAGNAAHVGLKTVIFLPERAPKSKVAQLLMFGAAVILVKGDYRDAYSLSVSAIDTWGWYNRNAAVNPYLVEGKKTVSFEICEQLNWGVPEFIAVSVGDGCTIAGIWKGFCDLFSMGWIVRLPRLIAVQAEGCCPIVRSIRENSKWVPMNENTLADSIAVGSPRNPDKAMRAVKESGGLAVTVSDDEILDAMRVLGNRVGVFAEPAGAAGLAGLIKLKKKGSVEKKSSAVVVVTGNGLKDINGALKAVALPPAISPDLETLKAILNI